MADTRITQRPHLELNVGIQLTGAEVRALDALVGYGIDAFLEVFYEHMGRHCLRPHEAGLRSLFETIRSELPAVMRRHDAALKAFALDDPIIRSRKDHDALIERLTAQARQGKEGGA